MQIERNFKKHPHTARFLMSFHTAGGTRTGGAVAEAPNTWATEIRRGTEALMADDNAAEYELAAQDLLELVPDAPADLRSAAQADYMEVLIAQITELDAETGAKARKWTDDATAAGHWTPGRQGTSSDWISRMVARRDLLKATAAAKPTTPAPEVEIPAGRYAITDTEVKCYALDYGKPGTRWEGFTFLNRISSDDRFPVKNPSEKARILGEIAKDVDGSAVLAGLTLRQCRRCGRTLSDTKNPHFHRALGPDCGEMQ